MHINRVTTYVDNRLIGTPKPLISSLFLLSREYVRRKPTLAFALRPRYTPSDAQVPRHPPHHNCDAHADRRDALAPGGATPSAGGKQQAGARHRLRGTRFPLARTSRFGLLPVFIGASAFGGAIELIQPSFNRSADFNDWVADVVGVALGIGCGLLYRRLRRR